MDGPVRYTRVGESLKRNVSVLMNQQALFYSIILDFVKIKNDSWGKWNCILRKSFLWRQNQTCTNKGTRSLFPLRLPYNFFQSAIKLNPEWIKMTDFFFVFNASFNNDSVILWLSDLLAEEAGVSGVIHRLFSGHWQILLWDGHWLIA